LARAAARAHGWRTARVAGTGRLFGLAGVA
jgi:hypothetical protein